MKRKGLELSEADRKKLLEIVKKGAGLAYFASRTDVPVFWCGMTSQSHCKTAKIEVRH